MKIILYCVGQCTWGILQSLVGLINFLIHIRDRHYFYHGAVITEWNDKSSVSLGMFVFVTKEPYFYDKLKDEKISYFSFFTETWANKLGEKVTGEKSMENLVID